MQKVPKFAERKEHLLINMADTREVDDTLVPDTNGKSDLWIHLVYVKLSGGTPNISTHMKRHHTIFSHLRVTNGRPTCLSTSVGIPAF